MKFIKGDAGRLEGRLIAYGGIIKENGEQLYCLYSTNDLEEYGKVMSKPYEEVRKWVEDHDGSINRKGLADIPIYSEVVPIKEEKDVLLTSNDLIHVGTQDNQEELENLLKRSSIGYFSMYPHAGKAKRVNKLEPVEFISRHYLRPFADRTSEEDWERAEIYREAFLKKWENKEYPSRLNIESSAFSRAKSICEEIEEKIGKEGQKACFTDDLLEAYVSELNALKNENFKEVEELRQGIEKLS